jgi:voltage-gated potassium channel
MDARDTWDTEVGVTAVPRPDKRGISCPMAESSEDSMTPSPGSTGEMSRSGPVVRPLPKLPPRRERTESAFEDWLAAANERADPLMAWLGVVFALLVGFELAVSLSPGADSAIQIVSWFIWAAFAVEFAVQVWLAPLRLVYLRRRWWRLIFLVLPFLRVLSFLRLARLGRALPASRVVSSSYRAAGTARILLRSRLGYLGALAALAVVAIGQLIYLLERESGSEAFETFGGSMVWSATTVIAMQGNPVPGSPAGQILMIVGFLIGLVLVASLAGVVGTFLVDERKERASIEGGEA